MSTLDWLYGLQTIGVKLGLENMRRLIGEISPPTTPPLTFHVAGTNGKGSVCACIDAITRAHGLRTGLFTSPHLIRFHERIRVNGECIPDKALDSQLEKIRATISRWDPHPSFFEVALALALAHFYAQAVECLVVETGLGGRLDATNALEPRHVSVITPIHYDHTQILGETLDAIAREKAGIFRPGVPIVSAAQPPEAELALRQVAATRRAPIEFVTSPYQGPLSLAGSHQRANAALAIAAVRAGGLPLSAPATRLGLEDVHWPARFQHFPPHHVIDGAHNTASTTALVETWRHEYGTAKATVIFGCVQDKQPAEILSLLAEIACRFLLTPIPSARSASPEELQPLLSEESACEVLLAPRLEDALEIAARFAEPVLVTGSLFLAGQALALLSHADAPKPTLQ